MVLSQNLTGSGGEGGAIIPFTSMFVKWMLVPKGNQALDGLSHLNPLLPLPHLRRQIFLSSLGKREVKAAGHHLEVKANLEHMIQPLPYEALLPCFP